MFYSSKHPFFKIGDTVHCALDLITAPTGEFKLYLAKEGVDATAFQQKLVLKLSKDLFILFKMDGPKKISIVAFLKKMNRETFSSCLIPFLGNRISVKQELETQKPLFKLWESLIFSPFRPPSFFFIALLQGLLDLFQLIF